MKEAKKVRPLYIFCEKTFTVLFHDFALRIGRLLCEKKKQNKTKQKQKLKTDF